MKILFLSHYFPPEVNAPASRTYEHCKEWCANGHYVQVITCAPNHPRGNVFEGYKNSLFFREVINGVNVCRVWTYLTANEGFLKRTLNYVSFMFAGIFASLFYKKKFDVVVTTSPQFFNGLTGYFVSRIKRTPWVLEIRDLWPDSILAVGAINNKLIIKILKIIELFCYRKCSHIVVVTDSFKDHMIRLGISSEKITVIKNGVDLELFQPPLSGSQNLPGELLAKFNELKGKFVAAYVGTHGMAHHLETILEAAEQLKGENRIHFLLVGDGAERQKLFQIKEENDLKNVSMIGLLPKEAMPYIWHISDVSLIVLKKDELFETVIPSKMFESMAMRKPIIMGVKGEAKRLLLEADSGIPIEPEDFNQLKNAVLTLFENTELARTLGNNGHEFVYKNYDRKALAKKYLGVFSGVVASTEKTKVVDDNFRSEI